MPRLVRWTRLVSIALITVCCGWAAMLLLLAGIERATDLLVNAVVLVAIAALLYVRPKLFRFVSGHARFWYLVMVVGGPVAAVGLYVAAGVLLRNGPNAAGWEVLGYANRVAAWTAVLCAASQVLIAIHGSTRVKERTTALVVLAVTTAVPVVTLILLGNMMLGLEHGSESLALDAVLLAMNGVGLELISVPIAFLAAAAMVPVGALLHNRHEHHDQDEHHSRDHRDVVEPATA